jgi:hypothetical protein
MQENETYFQLKGLIVKTLAFNFYGSISLLDEI